MARLACGVALAAAAVLAGRAATEVRGNRSGMAYAVEDDLDALEAAIGRATEHCDNHGRYAVLQAIGSADDDDRLVTFDCAETRGGGIALAVDEGDEGLDEAADDFCDDYGRDAVLQSVSEIDRRRVAAFNCIEP
jgi:hypothetical protein